MESMQEKHRESGLKILAVASSGTVEQTQDFADQFNTSFTIVYDPDGRLAKEYAIQGMPSSLLFDRDSTLRIHHTGFRVEDPPKLESEIVKLTEQ